MLKLQPAALQAAVEAAAKSGAALPLRGGESAAALLARLGPMFFDPQVDPIVTNKNPPPGEDVLSASADSRYSGVRMADPRDLTTQMLEYSAPRR